MPPGQVMSTPRSLRRRDMTRRAGALVAAAAATAALPAAAQARKLDVDVKFDRLEANIGAIPGLPDGTIVDAAFRATKHGPIIPDQLRAVYLATTPEERNKDTTTSYFEWHEVGSKPGDDEEDSLRGELTVKKKYILTVPGRRQVKSYRGHWTIVDGQGIYGAVFSKGGSGTVVGRDDCTSSGCKGYIRFKGTLD